MKFLSSLTLLSALLYSMPLHAQWLGTDYPFTTAPQINYSANSFLNFSVLNQAVTPDAKGGKGAHPATRAAAGQGPTVAQTASQLAANFPQAAQAQMQAAYTAALAHFEQVMQRLGQPREDVASAMAAFLIGNQMVLRGQGLPPDAEFVSLCQQLRTQLQKNTGFQQARAAQRRQAYQQLAMVGMFMAESRLALQQQPRAEVEKNLRQHAQANLQHLLGEAAQRVEVRNGILQASVGG